MADLQDIAIIDPGVDDSIAKLTPERIEETINRVLTQECAARLEVYLQTCVHCGLCAEACQSYVSRNGDPDYAPVAKVKDTHLGDGPAQGKSRRASSSTTRRASPSSTAAPAAVAACTARSGSTSRI